MIEPVWLTADLVIAVHAKQLVRFGGLPGVRDMGALESVLGRPVNKFHYEGETDRHRLAAAYVYALAKNHAFNDGNKRVAFLSGGMFLESNAFRLEALEGEAVIMMLGIASGEFAEEGCARWLSDRSRATSGLEPARAASPA